MCWSPPPPPLAEAVLATVTPLAVEALGFDVMGTLSAVVAAHTRASGLRAAVFAARDAKKGKARLWRVCEVVRPRG